MDATKLKYIAALCMLLDHVAVFFFSPAAIPWVLFRLVGRLAFPLFAWFAAEGLHKTGDRKKYLLRLGLFALVGEGPFLLTFGADGPVCSVMVTLFLAVGAMALFERLRDRLPLPTALLPLLAALLLAELARCDYGAPGVLLVSALYLLGESRRGKFLALGLWSSFTYLVWMPMPGMLSRLPAGVYTPRLWEIVCHFAAENLPFMVPCALFACLAIPLLSYYNGERGVGHKWFFYWFYPVHLLLLFLFSQLLP